MKKSALKAIAIALVCMMIGSLGLFHASAADKVPGEKIYLKNCKAYPTAYLYNLDETFAPWLTGNYTVIDVVYGTCMLDSHPCDGSVELYHIECFIGSPYVIASDVDEGNFGKLNFFQWVWRIISFQWLYLPFSFGGY